MARRRTEYQVLPLREELESLVHTYYHLHNEHKQAAPESSRRRRTEERMLEVRADGLIDVHFALTPRGRPALHAAREG